MTINQIFDWMLEQIKTQCEILHLKEPNGSEFDAIEVLDVENIINEAEAKWESVMAELENELKLADEEKKRCSRENPLQFDTAKGYANGISNAIEIVRGKSIKISEVE